MRHVIIAAWLCIAIQPSAADTITLRYGQIPSTVRSASTLYLSIAQQKGFLAREGIKLELVPIAGPSGAGGLTHQESAGARVSRSLGQT
jgi:ABC-type nitrate/sulfonate/bicarbonate transport system substrate-binding protein